MNNTISPQKGKNTRERSEYLKSLVAKIAERDNIDPASPPRDIRLYLIELSILGNCHKETARKLLRKYIEGKNNSMNWGGKRKNAGRKPNAK